MKPSEFPAGWDEQRVREVVHVRSFRSDKYCLTENLLVTLDEEKGQVVAYSYDTGQYGYGASPELAIEHLCAVLEDYYELLWEDRGRLSPRLESHLRYLDSILVASPPGLLAAYREMAADENREAEAQDWAEGTFPVSWGSSREGD